MIESNGDDHWFYQNKLRQLSAVIGQFSNHTRVMWLNQYPTIDKHRIDIFTDKIYRYNKVVRLLFK
jgi:hypothetical protein